MSKRNERRRNRSNPNLVVYGLAAILLVVVALLAYNLLSAGRDNAPAGQWSEPPAMHIDVNRRYTALIETTKGPITVELLPQAAPVTVNNFVFLARQGFYDGVTFHRVLPNFVAQGGDPTGTGSGGPGYFIASETEAGLTFDSEGVVAMANSGEDRNGSQFFITYSPQPGLDGGYTIFGRVTSGMDAARALTPRDPASNPNAPPGDVINTITITEE
jgi:cyclophilin family peptidyl-prolyl cis-trans isomerase